MKMKQLLAMLIACIFACSLIRTVGANLAYHWGWDIPGDVNGDGTVDGRDITIVAKAFGSTPNSTNWNEAADVNLDGKVDGRDITIVAKEFGFYVKKEVDYETLAVDQNEVPYASAYAKLFILNNNLFYVSVEWFQIVPLVGTNCVFQVGQEGTAIQGAQDDRATSFSYGEGETWFNYGTPEPWYAKGYTYIALYPLPTDGYFKFEMWGSLNGTTTYTILFLMTYTDLEMPAFGGSDFQIVNY
jgi:hypothetical protein